MVSWVVLAEQTLTGDGVGSSQTLCQLKFLLPAHQDFIPRLLLASSWGIHPFPLPMRALIPCKIISSEAAWKIQLLFPWLLGERGWSWDGVFQEISQDISLSSGTARCSSVGSG